MTVWRGVIYNGIDLSTRYEASDEGVVRNAITKKVIASSANRKGYFQIHLNTGEKKYTAKLHRIIAETFIPNPKEKPTVNHKDGKKNNNKVSNLEWATEKEQNEHKAKILKKNVGKNNPNAKRIEVWDKTKNLYMTFDCVPDAATYFARRYNKKEKSVYTIITDCAAGRRKNYLGYTFRYAK